MAHQAAATTLRITQAEGSLLPSGQIEISTRFDVRLPEELQVALREGLPLYFDLNYRLKKPSYPAYKLGVRHWFSDDEILSYKLSFHPITHLYRVSVGAFSSDYRSLDASLRAIGAVRSWRILPKGSLSGYTPDEIDLEVRLLFRTSSLPSMFQTNVLTSQKWVLDSSWENIPITQEGKQ